MEEITYINYIDIRGEEIRLDDLSEEKKKQIAIILSDHLMAAAGYRRKNV